MAIPCHYCNLQIEWAEYLLHLSVVHSAEGPDEKTTVEYTVDWNGKFQDLAQRLKIGDGDLCLDKHGNDLGVFSSTREGWTCELRVMPDQAVFPLILCKALRSERTPVAAPRTPEELTRRVRPRFEYNLDYDPLCAVCLDEFKNVVAKPCQHMCVCTVCAVELRACPICRSDVTEWEKVYI